MVVKAVALIKLILLAAVVAIDRNGDINIKGIEEHLQQIRLKMKSTVSHSTCLDFFVGDNFGAGWNDAKLYIYDNQGNFDSYTPNITSHETNIKYCYDFEGKVLTKSVVGSHIERKVYPSKDLFLYATMQYFHILSPYSIRWTTTNEKTQEVYVGNHLTKMVFQFTDVDINFVSALDLPSSKVNPSSCKSCLLGKVQPRDTSQESSLDNKLTLRIRRNGNEYAGAPTDMMKEMELFGHDNTWFRDDGRGTTYEITDLTGIKVLFAGQLCSGDSGGSVCAIALSAGQYIWRVNGALDPHRDAVAWTFCDTQGGARMELFFEINDEGNCIPGVHRYSYEETKEDESAVAMDTENAHRVLLQGTFDLTGLNSAELTTHEKAMLEYFITAQFNDVKSVNDMADDVAKITAWQQAIPESYYRRGLDNSAVVDRVTFNIHINLDSYKLGGHANSTTKELVANFKRYIALVMESGAFISRMHKVRESKLREVVKINLVELVKVSESGGHIDFDDYESADFIMFGALLCGIVVGLLVWQTRCRSRVHKIKIKD